jgi:3-methyladenine DNA glycosylase AlkD
VLVKLPFMTPEILFNEIRLYGEKHVNQERIQKYLRYFKEGYDAYGLDHGQVEAKVKEILSFPGITQEFILELSLLLVRSPKYEMTVIAIQLVRSYYKNWIITTFKTVEKWFSIGITNWAQTDYICGELMNLFFKKGLVELNSISEWRLSPNKFQRRAAVVSLIKPMKVSHDFQPFFEFIDPMMMDPDREVHQGLGWFLREAWKKQPDPTELFLMKWKNTSARLIFQYATEKMTPEGKQKFKRDK